jgi:hypothetical protein
MTANRHGKIPGTGRKRMYKLQEFNSWVLDVEDDTRCSQGERTEGRSSESLFRRYSATPSVSTEGPRGSFLPSTLPRDET